MTDTIIIPDVHGRTFWKGAVANAAGARVIFLGDYLDPYPFEAITPEAAIENFREILAFAAANPECQLLLGNHDLHYLCNFGEDCRMDYDNSARIHSLLLENLHRFKLIDVRTIGGKTVVFSHAPILTGWIRSVGLPASLAPLADRLNALVADIACNPFDVERYLGRISPRRGGVDEFGSPVWADLAEVDNNLIPDADYSVFGHTLRPAGPVITPSWACLDCRRPFRIDPTAIEPKLCR